MQDDVPVRSASAVVIEQNLLPTAPELSRLSVASCSLSVPQVWIVKVRLSLLPLLSGHCHSAYSSIAGSSGVF